jgi:hypothetical protein
MQIGDEKKDALKRMLWPTAASVAGAGAGLVLSRRNKLHVSMPSFDSGGIGDLAEDLRDKVTSAIGKVDSSSTKSTSGRGAHRVDPAELEERRRQRQQRREQRARR